jgi:protein-tyrosine phosphatase
MAQKRKLVGIIGHENILREADSHGIINIDNDSLMKYKKEREIKLKMIKVIDEYDELKRDVEEIKSLLKKLLDKR